jgi:Mg2+ and Co2+ transporter CorA
MKIRCIKLSNSKGLESSEDLSIAVNSRNKDANIWVNIEGASKDEFVEILKKLNITSNLIVSTIYNTEGIPIIEKEDYYLQTFMDGSNWMKYNEFFHLIIFKGLVITVRKNEISESEIYFKRWWLDRMKPENKLTSLVFWIIQGYLDDEILAYKNLRVKLDKHAQGLKHNEPEHTIEKLEELMAEGYYMSTFFHDYLLFIESWQFSRSKPLQMAPEEKEFFGASINAIKNYFIGIEQLRKRMTDIQQQHIMDQQQLSDGRFKVLTVISAVFLPLTLIAGIYGMNFPNMPIFTVPYSYHIVILLMLLISIGMISYFYINKWFK